MGMKALAQSLVMRGYISKRAVIHAMEKVDRKFFVLDHLKKHAYIDHPLEIGSGQTISAPHMVGIMVENLDLEKNQKVLEIGTGSGYHAAIVAEIVKPAKVYTIERYPELADMAVKNLKMANISNVIVIVGDGSRGLKKHAPYDRIFVTCGAPYIPKPLTHQLKDPGKLMIPVGDRYMQDLIVLEKKEGKTMEKNLGGCMFVPLIGEYGF